MRLDAARLCLDCEEVHEDQVCPLCGSEAFAFLTRWVHPAGEKRVEHKPEPMSTAPPRTQEQLDAYRQLLEGAPPRGRGLLAKSALGLAVLGLAGWAWRTAGRSGDRDVNR
jgi:hypothetical protein